LQYREICSAGTGLEPVAVVLSVSGALLRRFILRLCREKCKMARLGRCRRIPHCSQRLKRRACGMASALLQDARLLGL
jgi:hypothetical protein